MIVPTRRLLSLPAILLIAATPATPQLQPGLWEFTNTPESATLDRRALADLPYTAPTAPQQTCLTPADAAQPARWFARDSGKDCTFGESDVARGRVSINATCPPHDAGNGSGTVRLTGRWTPTSYSLHFVTATEGDNGVMGFTGTMTGRRVGACPG